MYVVGRSVGKEITHNVQIVTEIARSRPLNSGVAVLGGWVSMMMVLVLDPSSYPSSPFRKPHF